MNRRTTRGNRVGLLLVGALLLLAGVGVALLSTGVFGADRAGQPVYPESAAQWVNANPWLWWAALAVAVVVALLALRWLVVQIRIDRIHRLSLDTDRDPDPAAGRTDASAKALTRAVEDDILGIDGVRVARADLSGHADAPELWLKVTTDNTADTAHIRRRIVDDVVRDARTALELPALPAYLTLTVSRRGPARVIA